MYSYLKVNRCRVCEHPDDNIVSSMDKELLNETPVNEVMARFSGNFTNKSKPLTQMSVYAHKKHLLRAVPSALLEIPDLSANSTGTSLEKTNGARSKGFDDFLGTTTKNREMLDNIVSSATEDLINSDELLEMAVGPKNKALVLSVRDRLRESLAGYIELSKSLVSPTMSVSIVGGEGDRVVELLVLIRQAFENTVEDPVLREQFFNEVASLIRKSATLRDIFEREMKKDAKPNS